MTHITPSTASQIPLQTSRRIGEHQGSLPGPLLLVVGGIHGNEYSGVLAARRVVDKLALDARPFRGRFVALVGNLAALALDQRFIDVDLNRQWQAGKVVALEEGGGGSAPVEEREQRHLLAELRQEMDQAEGEIYFVDLHTSSAHGAPFVTVGDTLRNRAFALKLGLPVVLGLEEQIDGALLEYMNNLGHVTAGIEAGRHDAPASVDHHEAALWLALSATGNMDAPDIPQAAALRRLLRKSTPGIPRIMEVRHRHPVTAEDQFVMEPGYTNFDPVPAGKVVARDRNGPLRSRRKCRMLLPLYQAQGTDGYFLVRSIRPFWLVLSAILRRSGLPALMRWLPGVKVLSGREETLMVDTRIGRFLPMQIFHLMGYRRVRWQGNLLVVSRRRFDTRR
jgi:succinylglutamate desuccinylase